VEPTNLGYIHIHHIYPKDCALFPSSFYNQFFVRCCKPAASEVRHLSLLLVVAHLLGLLQQLGGIVDGAESTDGGVDALVHQVAGDDDPEGVHQHEVAPVVGGLGAGVGNIEDVVVEERGRVVENVTVELAQRDDELQRVAQRVVDGDEVGGEEGEGTPEGLRTSISKLFPADARQIHTAVTVSMHKTKASWVR
jgi:hypothetical protein